jgi:hypothetical protein
MTNTLLEVGDEKASKLLLADIATREKAVFAENPEVKLDKYGLGPWSFSKAKVMGQCPYQFYLKYILGVKRKYLNTDTLVSDVGTSAHRILELIMRGKDVSTAYKEAAKEIIGAPKGGFGKASLTAEQWKDKIETLEMNISTFAEAMDTFQRKNNVKRIHTELKIGVNRDFEPTGFMGEDVFYRGICDLILQIDTGGSDKKTDLVIIDHKHGGGEFNTTVKNYQSQLDTYKVLFHHGIEPIAGAQSGIHFIKEGKRLWGDYKSAETIEKTLRGDIEWKLDGICDKVKELGFFKHIRGQTHCQYCEFNAECKAGVLKENEISTKKRFPIKVVNK